MKNTKHILVIKHVAYSLILLFLYIVQSVPGLFVLFRNKPVWVIPMAVALAMFEGEFVGGIYGAVAGLLCDMGGFSLVGDMGDTGGYSIFGFNGLICALCCIVTGLLVIYLMRCNVLGFLIFVFLTMLLRGSLDVLFSYFMWGYENVWKIYMGQTISTALYTTAVAPLLFFFVRGVYGRFEMRLNK